MNCVLIEDILANAYITGQIRTGRQADRWTDRWTERRYTAV